MAGFCALDLLSKAYYTMEKTLAPLAVNGGILLFNWGLNRFLSPSLGAAGLALATALSLTAGGIMLAFLLLRKVSDIRLSPLLKCLAGTLVTGALLQLVTDHVVSGDEGKILLVIKCLVLGGLAAGVYLVFMYMTRQEDFFDLLRRYFPNRFPKDPKEK